MSTTNQDILKKLNAARTKSGKEKPSPPAKQSDKKKAVMKASRQERGDSDTELQKWFNDRHKEMTGTCRHCGERSCKGDSLHFRSSIAHILPQRLFPSVALHKLNWIELCFWAPNSCHTNFDNHILDLIDLNCFAEVIEKFVAIYPAIDKKERKNIPDVLLQYVEVEK